MVITQAASTKSKVKMFKKFLILTMLSAILGVILSFVPWGDPHFHGKGLPFPIVYWEDDKDFNNYLAPLMNMVFVFVSFILIALSVSFLLRGASFLKKIWESENRSD
jgi:hypothetical protein